VGSRRLPAARPQFLAMARDGRDGDALRAEERPVRRPADAKQLVASPAFKNARGAGQAAAVHLGEFGWDNPEQPAYLSVPARYRRWPPRPTSNSSPSKTISRRTATKARKRSTADGRVGQVAHLGTRGDQVRIFDRKVESLLLPPKFSTRPPRRWAPPRNAICWTRRGETSWPRKATTWTVRIVALARRPDGPRDRLEDYHNFTWARSATTSRRRPETGSASARRFAGTRCQADRQCGATAWRSGGHGLQSARLDAQRPGHDRPHLPLPAETKDVVVKDSSGNTLPSQIVKSEKDARAISSSPTWRSRRKRRPRRLRHLLRRLRETTAASAKTDLQIDETKLTLENEHLRVRLDPTTGGIVSLVYKASGREMLDAGQGACRG